MSRSGYSDDFDGWACIRWRGAVNAAIRGRRGQAFLREMIAALDALPEKILIADDLVDNKGDVCAIGAVGKARGLDMSAIDVEDRDSVAEAFGIAGALAAEIEYENDEFPWHDITPRHRWQRMRKWCIENLREETPAR